MAIYPRVVYMITHNVTKRMYIGSTSMFNRRIQLHLNALRSGRHTVEDMQADYNNYGEDYSIEILDKILDKDRFRKEYIYMDLYKSHVRGLGYNYKDNQGIREKEVLRTCLSIF